MIESKIALWRARVADWKASGLSGSEFAAQHGLVASTLQWWAWRLIRKYGDPPWTTAGLAKPAEPRQTRGSRRRRKKKMMRPEIRIARVVPVARSPAQAAARYGAVVVELSEGRARITFDGGADLKLAAKLVATLATLRTR